MTVASRAPADRLHIIAGGYEAVYFTWPDMRAFRHKVIGPPDWEAFKPEQFRVTGDPTLPNTPDALLEFKRFMSRVPGDLVAQVARFPQDHWVLLAWAARTGVLSDDLLIGNPCLAFMLAKAASMGSKVDGSNFSKLGKEEAVTPATNIDDALRAIGEVE